MTENITLIRPGAGQSVTLQVGPDARLEFAFGQGEADLGKEGQNLVFTFPDGGKLVLEGFYDNFGDDAQPPVLIVDGAVLESEDFLAAQGDPDLMPATGPDAALIMMGHGLYEAVMLGGVQGMNALGKLGFDGMAPIATEFSGVDGVESMGSLALGSPSGQLYEPSSPAGPVGPPTPPPVKPPVEPPVEPPYQLSYNEYVTRGVFYNSGLEVNLLSVDYDAGTAKKAESLPGAVSFVFYDADGKPISDPCTAVYNPKTGIISFGTLTTEALYYCVITDDAGKSYSMQLVADPDRNFDSHAQDKATPPVDDKLWYGEWHAGSGNSQSDSKYHVVASDLDNTLTFTGGNYGMSGSSVTATDGNNNIDIKATGAGTGAAYGMASSSGIKTGDGDDTISITARGRGSVLTYGMSGSTISTGDGNDSISITASSKGTGKAYAMDNSSISSGAGDDTISITGDVRSASISTGADNDHVHIYGTVTGTGKISDKIDLGAGDDHLMITGNVSGMLLDGGANEILDFTGVQYADKKAHLGDILELGADHIASILTGTSANTIRNFESLLVDMDRASGHKLDELLDRFCQVRDAQHAKGDGGAGSLNGNNELQSLIVTGNDAHYLMDKSASSGIVQIAGMDANAAFDHYIVDHNGVTLHLYVQSMTG